jgi:hypothetical protein
MNFTFLKYYSHLVGIQQTILQPNFSVMDVNFYTHIYKVCTVLSFYVYMLPKLFSLAT